LRRADFGRRRSASLWRADGSGSFGVGFGSSFGEIVGASSGVIGGSMGDQTARRTRPFERRAESTLRPPTVLIRARKPWVRLRLMTDGWNVRFILFVPGK
jgi:hypothetical protein